MATKDTATPVAAAGKDPVRTLDDQTLAKIIEGVTAKMKEVQRVAPAGGAAGTTPGTSATTEGKFLQHRANSPLPQLHQARV